MVKTGNKEEDRMGVNGAAAVSYVAPYLLQNALGKIQGVALRSVEPRFRRNPPLGTIGGAGGAKLMFYCYRLVLLGLPTPPPILADHSYTRWSLATPDGKEFEVKAVIEDGALQLFFHERIQIATLNLETCLGLHSWPVQDVGYASSR